MGLGDVETMGLGDVEMNDHINLISGDCRKIINISF
jgi:hypothetical protein